VAAIKAPKEKISNGLRRCGQTTGVEVMAKSRSYDETLNEVLDDPAEAAAYLNVALEEGDPAVFLLALKDVANVHGGVAKVAHAANLNRESMYRMLSEHGNPTVNSLNALLHTLGLKLALEPDSKRPASSAG
jgi:probable addiction module antidote protein